MAEHPRFPAGPDDSRDPLEAELKSFGPAPLSAGFADRVGRELRRDSSRVWRLRASIGLGLAAAACAALALLWWDGHGDGVPGDVPAARPDLPPPTVAAYRQALADSPAALDALLDAHAPGLLPSARPSPAADAFHSSRISLSDTGDTL
jgi:hypothetical protein